MVDQAQEAADLPVSEYEREPVPASGWLGFKSFIGQYAAEHTAGTELMLGPLFVAAGVSAFDLVFGLLLAWSIVRYSFPGQEDRRCSR